MDWSNIKRFNFTYAIPDGAWLEDTSGYQNWEHYNSIAKHMGKEWFDVQLRKQGIFTGCWIDCK